MGNICRSPTAQGVFQALVEKEGLQDLIEVDSAGTHAYHVGEPPDQRAQETAQKRGFDLSDQRARRAVADDFLLFDYVVAMDQDNYHALYAICPEGMEEKIQLLMDYAPSFRTREVPDPYYGGPSGFEQVFDMVEAAAAGLLEALKQRHFS
ncbi:MAG TPA: low molecular weight phosphotyrosine protein phosphatase [Sedimenticola thiotaurini]|uniref:protein-tyrosine-phosphatase n=1 Tax=Sedimenticola thiotaurini TaxID=1543721 RepID=A0A831W4N1_9GAMM|nr:low molecular weight phosphotyrosine protein phosphatase [Sedimenticola thiotaurini]